MSYTAGTLLTFRFENGRSFPHSYKDFVQKYGYGRSCERFLIYISMGDYCDSFKFQSEGIKSTYSDALNHPKDVWFSLEPDADFGILKRLIPFSRSENG